MQHSTPFMIATKHQHTPILRTVSTSDIYRPTQLNKESAQ